MTVEGRQIELRPGDAFCILRGAAHRIDNFHPADAKMLALVTPGILGPDYFHDLAAIVKAAAGGPPDTAAVGAVMGCHGLTPAP